MMLQEDINNLVNWSSESGLQFNETKCKAQSITRKINPIPTTYSMNDSALASVRQERDLCVWISSNLTFNKHTNDLCTRTINSIKTRRTIYLTLVRSHLGYATQVWNLPFTTSVCYNTRLQTLHLLPICYWHEFLDMVHFFKAVSGFTSSSFRMHIKTTKCTRSSSNTKGVKYEVPRCKIRSPAVQNSNSPKIVLDKNYQNMERIDRHT